MKLDFQAPPAPLNPTISRSPSHGSSTAQPAVSQNVPQKSRDGLRFQIALAVSVVLLGVILFYGAFATLP